MAIERPCALMRLIDSSPPSGGPSFTANAQGSSQKQAPGFAGGHDFKFICDQIRLRLTTLIIGDT